MPIACPADAVGCSDTNVVVFGDAGFVAIVVALIAVVVVLVIRARRHGGG